MNTPEPILYRYELWKLDIDTLVHARVSDRRLDLNDPEITDGRRYAGYPRGYEWRVYRAGHQIDRFAT
jgi:hypothetical protein